MRSRGGIRPRRTMPAPLRKPQLLPRYRALAHQERAVDQAVEWEDHPVNGMRGGIWALAMGLGKSFMAGKLIAHDWTEDTGATLFVCPCSLTVNAFGEFRKFYGDTMRVLVYYEAYIGPLYKLFSPATPYKNHVVVTNYETLVSLAGHAGIIDRHGAPDEQMQRAARAFFGHPWHRVVCDESHVFSNPQSQAYAALMELAPGRRVCMTGTPMRNYSRDVLAQLFVCGYRSPRVTPDNPATWTAANMTIDGVRENVMVMSFEDANIEMPPLTRQRIMVDMGDRAREIYEAIRESVGSLVRRDMMTDVLSSYTRLRQICVAPHLLSPYSKIGGKKSRRDRELTEGSGAMFEGIHEQQWREESERWCHERYGESGTHSTKIATIVDIVVRKVPPDEKVIIFTGWIGAAKLIRDALLDVVERSSIVEMNGRSDNVSDDLHRFRTTRARILIMTTVGNVGMTMTEATHIVLVEPHFNAVRSEQAIARLWRIGQQRPVTVWEPIVRRSIEEGLLEMCETKKRLEEDLLQKPMQRGELLRILGFVDE